VSELTPPLVAPPGPSRVAIWTAGLSLLGVLSALIPPVAVPGVVLTLIGSLSFPVEAGGRARSLGRAATVLAAIGCLVGLGRFAVSKAMLGIVEGGRSVAAKSALWKLREIVIAEDTVRRTAPWDPDGDHVGSAAWVGALAGTAPIRPGRPLESPLLNYAFRESVDTAEGPAARVEGYLFLVCLPKAGGGFTARPSDPVDEESAERRYLAYAWPTVEAKGMATAFFADEHERLLVLDPEAGSDPPYLGTEHPPPCSAALGDDPRWKPWNGKKPREKLPGDR
jgi:hypothetical protein